AGFLLADLYLVDWKEAPVRSFWWDTSLLAWPLLVTLMLSNRLSALLAPAVLLCYIGAFRGRLSSLVLSRPQLTVIGGMCYSIYLLHYTVLMAVGSLTRKLSLGSGFATQFVFEALINLPVVLFVSVVFFAFLERPCMDPTWPSRVRERFKYRTGRQLRSSTP